jgi:glycosyltransferase involved in cell wall biosynthesis
LSPSGAAVDPIESVPSGPAPMASPTPSSSSSASPSVLITHGWGLGTPSGVARHVQELARHLALEGARVTVLCVSTSGYSRFPRPKLPAELHGLEIERELAALGVRIVRVDPHPLHWTLDGRPVRRAVERLLEECRIDAVLGFFNEAAYLPPLLKSRGVRFGYIATWLSYRMALSRERTGSGVRGVMMRAANQRFVVEPYRRAEILFANSEFTRRELVEVLGCDEKRIQVTYLGVRDFFHDIPRARLEKVERVLFFGRLVREKGILDALEALGRVARAGHPFQFRVLGSGNADHVRKVARQLGIGERVEVLPHQGDARLEEELERAHLALLPSHSESFGLSIAEAQAAGLPVVAYAAGSVPEVVEDGKSAWLAKLDDVDGLARALTAALSDPDECLRRGLRGRERVGRLFRWNHTARRVLDGLARLEPRAQTRVAA